MKVFQEGNQDFLFGRTAHLLKVVEGDIDTFHEMGDGQKILFCSYVVLNRGTEIVNIRIAK